MRKDGIIVVTYILVLSTSLIKFQGDQTSQVEVRIVIVQCSLVFLAYNFVLMISLRLIMIHALLLPSYTLIYTCIRTT